MTVSQRILQTVEFYEKNDYDAHQDAKKLIKTKSADSSYRYIVKKATAPSLPKAPEEEKDSAIKLTRIKFELQEFIDREDTEAKILIEKITNFLEGKNKYNIPKLEKELDDLINSGNLIFQNMKQITDKIQQYEKQFSNLKGDLLIAEPGTKERLESLIQKLRLLKIQYQSVNIFIIYLHFDIEYM